VNDLPKSAQAVVIGGGVIGCSVAYHLAARGWHDVVLVERDQLTSGTTWHAAGLVTQLRATFNLTKLARYTSELFRELEESGGRATGFIQSGSITIATTAERMTELRRNASMAEFCGVEAHVLSRSEALDFYPLLDATDVVGGVAIPGDGMASPADATQALAAAARAAGVRILQHTPVREVLLDGDRVTGVRTDTGTICTSVVVNCSGMWARELGRRSGVTVPLHAAEHFYLVTEPIADLPRDLPILRSLDEWSYVKSEAGKLLVGFFEPGAKPWATHGIPEDASFTTLEEDWDHIAPYFDLIARRVPLLQRVGIRLHFNGPESFTPDDRFILGEAPNRRGYFVAAGFNSVGFLSSGGAGRVLADWIVDGYPPMDLWDVDIRRFHAVQGNRRYLHDRTTETLGLLYDNHWPFRQFESARGLRRTPLHDRLRSVGAAFGELFGWERANWYAPPGEDPREVYSWGRQNWFAWSAQEHRAVRENVGLFDQSTFGKILVQGRDSCCVLNRICTADIDVPVGSVVYTQWLNERGGIEADLTVTRLAECEFLVVTPTATITRDLTWLHRNIPPESFVTVTDVTSSYAVLGVMGPRARDLLGSLTDCDLSDDAFPFGTSQEIDLGYALVRASRITYVGELGWELYVPSDQAIHVYDTIIEGDSVGMQHCGFHALNSLRLEKCYRSFGHDVSDEDTPSEAGLTFTHSWSKPGGFIGREAVLAQRDTGARRRLAGFALEDPAPLLYHNEPILRNGRPVGQIRSGWYGHTIGRAVGLGYVDDTAGSITPQALEEDNSFEIEIAGERVPARASTRPWYDPTGSRVRVGTPS
jgi:glycine cleavage system T protein